MNSHPKPLPQLWWTGVVYLLKTPQHRRC